MEMPKTLADAKALITDQAQTLDSTKSELALAEKALGEQEATIQTLTQEKTTLQASLDAKTLELDQLKASQATAIAELTGKLAAATAETDRLKQEAVSVEQKAQQLMAAVGQPPVEVAASENGKAKPAQELKGMDRIKAFFQSKKS